MQLPKTPVVIKKYTNRRLYDTGDSRYITLEELEHKIRAGLDVRVVDEKSGQDLTQATLTQIILENGRAARLLPVPLLHQWIRMSDDALGEFFSRYMTWALELYQHAKSSAQALTPLNPFATLPFSAGAAFARMFGQVWPQGDVGAPGPQAPPPPSAWPSPPGPTPDAAPPPSADAPRDELAEMRRELAELKAAILRKPG